LASQRILTFLLLHKSGVEMQDIIANPTKSKLIAIIFLSGTITLLHFLIPTDQHAFHILHIILRNFISSLP